MQLTKIFNWIESTSDSKDSDFIRRVLILIAIHHSSKLPNSVEQAKQIREECKTLKSTSKKVSENLLNLVTIDELPKPLADLPSVLFERLGNIATINKGLTPIQKAIPGEYPLVVTAKDRLSSSTYDFHLPAAIIPTVSSTGHGDASLKRIHYQEGKYAVGNILAVVQPTKPDLISARFIYEYLSVFKDELLVSRMVGTANVSLTVNKIMEVPIPLLAGSIINELSELMALCDQLEQKHSNALEAYETLVSHLLATLTQSQNAAEFNANWQRI
ncbi:MAG: restriction endonuclease subunit S, partial [Methylophilaceae bacterium]